MEEQKRWLVTYQHRSHEILPGRWPSEPWEGTTIALIDEHPTAWMLRRHREEAAKQADKLRTVQYEQVLAILSAVPILPGELDADSIAALEEFLSAEARR